MLRIAFLLFALAASIMGGWLVITEMKGMPEPKDVVVSERSTTTELLVAANTIYMGATVRADVFHYPLNGSKRPASSRSASANE